MQPHTYNLTLLSTTPLRGEAVFPKTHPGFQGHFPNHPILPGFLHIQLALDLLKKANLPATLLSVTSAKFLHQIPPHTAVTITLTPTELPQTYTAALTQKTQTLSHFTLTLTP